MTLIGGTSPSSSGCSGTPSTPYLKINLDLSRLRSERRIVVRAAARNDRSDGSDGTKTAYPDKNGQQWLGQISDL
jgi:hypothetical protein